MYQKINKQFQLSIQCCQNCYQHTQQNHTESNYINKINQIQTELIKSWTWKYSQVKFKIKIKKNQKIEKPRISAFQVKFRRLLIYSKLKNQDGLFPRVHDIVMMVMSLVQKDRSQIERIRNRLGQEDLYSYLKSRTQNIKLSLKFTVNQISKIILFKPEEMISKITPVTLNLSKNLQNKQNKTDQQKLQISQTTQRRPQRTQKPYRNALTATSRSNKYKNLKSIKRIDSLKSQFSKSKKQLYTQSQDKDKDKDMQPASTIFKGLFKQSSKNSVLQNKIGSKQFRKISQMYGKQEQSKKVTQKYTYLSKQVDKIDLRRSQKDGEYQYNTNNTKIKIDQQFQLLQLSNQEQQQQIEQKDQQNQWNEQKILQRKIQQGLNFNLTASYMQRKGSRKYSFEFKKFAQLLCMQLKQDQNLNQQILKQSTASMFKKTGFAIDQNQNTSNQSSNQELLINQEKYGIQTEKLLASKHAIETPDDDEQDMMRQDMEGENQEKIDKGQQEKISQKGISIQNIQSQQNNDDNCGQLEEFKCQISQKSFKRLKSSKKIIQPKMNYKANFVHSKIQGIIQQRQQIQIFIDVHYLSSLQILSKVILNVCKISPQFFAQILQNNKFQEIQLSTNPSFCQVVIFNPILGYFQRIKLKIELSCAYEGDIPFWVLVICQSIKIVLQNNENKLFDLLRILTGAPIVKISAIDLRKVKKIIVDSFFGNQQGKKGRVVCIKAEQNNDEQSGQLSYCQMTGLQKNKDFLQSIVSYREYISQNKQNNQQTKTKLYEQFVLQYQNLMLWFYEDKYSHNQQICKFQKEIRQQKQNQDGDQIDMRQIIKQKSVSWKIQFQIFEHSQVFLQFTEHEKVQKTNHILISKIFKKGKKSVLEPVGELNKKGNFFFELSLEASSYIVQINRTFDNQQSNSIHFYSSNLLKINKSIINDKSLQQFTQQSDQIQIQL